MTFIEVKIATQERVKEDFSNFFFAFTENEITAAAQLGERCKVVLYNKHTKALLVSSLQQLMVRASSTTWQVSIQLRPATPDGTGRRRIRCAATSDASQRRGPPGRSDRDRPGHEPYIAHHLWSYTASPSRR